MLIERLENMLQGRFRVEKSKPHFDVLIERLNAMDNLGDINWYFFNRNLMYSEATIITKEDLINRLYYRFSLDTCKFRNTRHQVFYNNLSERHYINIEQCYYIRDEQGILIKRDAFKFAEIDFLRNI